METWNELEATHSVLEVAGLTQAPPITHQPDLTKQQVLFGAWWREGRTYIYIYDAAGQAVGQVRFYGDVSAGGGPWLPGQTWLSAIQIRIE